MVVVAIAGGTGNVGRTIAETLSESSKHKVIVLGRKAQSISANVPTYVVDYADIQATAQLLDQHGVDTVISAIQVTDEDSSTGQVNLIRSAKQTDAVKRFIASSWGALPSETSPVRNFQQASEDELRNSKLEWTRFVVGYFLDYYGIPRIRTHLPAMSFAVDMHSKKAAIPGTGDEPITFTYSFDVAKFVAAYLDVPAWEETTYCYGEKTTWNAFIEVAEEVTGTPFDVTYDSIEKLAMGQVTELPSHKEEFAISPFPEALARQILALLGAWVVGGHFYIPLEKTINRKFPAIKPMTVREMLLFREGA